MPIADKLVLQRQRHLKWRALDRLEFVLSDDGPGFDPTYISASRGMTGMRDRLEAIGGALAISSSPGAGTTVRGRVPTS